ncbi:MAG: CBS domain-containing protein, partial [Pirellulaceae bacterium]|nr:CBS domain-containing protein [Pirellulaceae bacterium]
VGQRPSITVAWGIAPGIVGQLELPRDQVMRRKPPHVRDHMTHLPVESDRCETVAEAVRLMDAHQIRHLPIMTGSRLRGIVSQRDILAARLCHGDALDEMPLDSICRTDVLTVSPVAPIDQVAEQMLARHVGSAVVVDGGYVVGMFTTTDALHVLQALFAKS